ncbi:hypothetical protein D3C78_18460 [compost metagenome]
MNQRGDITPIGMIVTIMIVLLATLALRNVADATTDYDRHREIVRKAAETAVLELDVDGWGTPYIHEQRAARKLEEMLMKNFGAYSHTILAWQIQDINDPAVNPQGRATEDLINIYNVIPSNGLTIMLPAQNAIQFVEDLSLAVTVKVAYKDGEERQYTVVQSVVSTKWPD